MKFDGGSIGLGLILVFHPSFPSEWPLPGGGFTVAMKEAIPTDTPGSFIEEDEAHAFGARLNAKVGGHWCQFTTLRFAAALAWAQFPGLGSALYGGGTPDCSPPLQ